MMTSISIYLFHAGLFNKINFVLSQLKHLTPKNTSLGISQMWSTICSPLKLTEILGTLSDSVLLKINLNGSDVE